MRILCYRFVRTFRLAILGTVAVVAAPAQVLAFQAPPSSHLGPEPVEGLGTRYRASQFEGPWGAIAFWRVGSQWLAGAAANYDTPLYAESKARESCGGDECSMAMTFQNECGALAVSVVPPPMGTVRMGWATGATNADARDTALLECRENLGDLVAYGASCAVEMSICSGNVPSADSGTAAQLPPTPAPLEDELELVDSASSAGEPEGDISGPGPVGFCGVPMSERVYIVFHWARGES